VLSVDTSTASFYDSVGKFELLPAGSGVDARITSRASVYDAVSTVDDASLVGNAERSQSVQIIATPWVVRLLWQTAHPWSDVVRNCMQQKGNVVL
jgi:hypothetical protein